MNGPMQRWQLGPVKKGKVDCSYRTFRFCWKSWPFHLRNGKVTRLYEEMMTWTPHWLRAQTQEATVAMRKYQIPLRFLKMHYSEIATTCPCNENKFAIEMLYLLVCLLHLETIWHRYLCGIECDKVTLRYYRWAWLWHMSVHNYPCCSHTHTDS
jgi:hypothetical protein